MNEWMDSFHVQLGRALPGLLAMEDVFSVTWGCTDCFINSHRKVSTK